MGRNCGLSRPMQWPAGAARQAGPSSRRPLCAIVAPTIPEAQMTEPTKINDQISVAAQISLADLAAFKAAGYTTVINNRPDNEEPGQLDHATVEAEAKKQGLAYVYQPI